ncbi:MAG TPA: hypothetical protein DCY13_06920, partial [Verrucomicrobiales bacterium]|nr:hypothetical protein [Verrucomicrobiales bacterium]
AQSNGNKRLEKPFTLARSQNGDRWIITAWEQCDRPWANPPVPCIHSTDRQRRLAPGETGRLRGWLWYYEGTDIQGELKRLRSTMDR